MGKARVEDPLDIVEESSILLGGAMVDVTECDAKITQPADCASGACKVRANQQTHLHKVSDVLDGVAQGIKVSVVLDRNFIKECPCHIFGGRVGVRFVGGHLLDGFGYVAELRRVVRVVPRIAVPNHNEIFHWNLALS